MKICVISDAHMEMSKEASVLDIPCDGRDLLILAGDIDVGTKADAFILEQLVEGDVIYVLGNHEFYGQVLPDVRGAWAGPTSKRINAEAKQNGYRGTLYVLDDSSVTLGGINFIGATLWTDFASSPLAPIHAEGMMNDYRLIATGIDKDEYPPKKILTPWDTIALHNKSRYFIEQELAKEGRNIVITHHLPSFQSIGEGFQGSPLNPAYASHLDGLIEDLKPELWIHGHTHLSFSYTIGETRILCNPRGYIPMEANPNFDPSLTIDY